MLIPRSWTHHRSAPVVAWVRGVPLSAWLIGAIVTTALLSIEALAVWATPTDQRFSFNWFRTLSLPVMSGYLIAAMSAVVSSVSRALRDLAPLLSGGGAEAEAAIAGAGAPPVSRLLIVPVVGLGVPLGLGAALTDRVARALAGVPIDVFYAGAAVLFWSLFTLTVVYMLEAGAALGRVASGPMRVDLFHLETLRPFGWFGLRQALLAVGGVGLAVLMMQTPDSQQAWLLSSRLFENVPLIVPVLGVTAVVGVVTFVQPMWAIRRRIQREKAELLSRVAQQLGPHWEATADLGDHEGSLRMPALLALRTHVAGLTEWPLDDWMKRRFGLYLLIPVISLVLKSIAEGLLQDLLI